MSDTIRISFFETKDGFEIFCTLNRRPAFESWNRKYKREAPARKYWEALVEEVKGLNTGCVVKGIDCY